MGYLRRTPVNVLTRAGVRHDVVPDTAARYADAFVAELQAFVDCVRSGTPPPVTGADSRAALAVGLAATRALREGRPVSPLKGRFFHLWGARPWMLGLPPSNSPQRGEDKAFS
ncbi:MAG: Gfo/Idh/MocA family oxidoreductase, partial [Anaerolineae bacterium]